jgi:hypothetical protein
LFFAREVAKIITVGHDSYWADITKNTLRKHKVENCHVLSINPTFDPSAQTKDPADPDHYVTAWEGMLKYSFYDYVVSIEDYPDSYFDIVIIDGRSRPSCFKHALSKVKVGGYIVWDDTDRPRYARAIEAVPNTLQLVLSTWGPAHKCRFKQTMIWCRVS